MNNRNDNRGRRSEEQSCPQKNASFEKRVGGNGRSIPSSPSNARWSECRGAGPCQALAAEGGGRKARLYKGQASPATIATSGPMGCDSRPRARAKPLAGRYITHSFFKRAEITFVRRAGQQSTGNWISCPPSMALQRLYSRRSLSHCREFRSGRRICAGGP